MCIPSDLPSVTKIIASIYVGADEMNHVVIKKLRIKKRWEIKSAERERVKLLRRSRKDYRHNIPKRRELKGLNNL